MDYIQKTVEDWQNSELKKRIDALELFAINHGFPEWDKPTIPDFLTHALTEQASLFRKGLGEEKNVTVLNKDETVAERIGSNSRRTQTLENWEKLGI